MAKKSEVRVQKLVQCHVRVLRSTHQQVQNHQRAEQIPKLAEAYRHLIVAGLRAKGVAT